MRFFSFFFALHGASEFCSSMTVSPQFPSNVRRLSFKNNRNFTDQALIRLLRSPKFFGLRELDLSWTGVRLESDEAKQALGDAVRQRPWLVVDLRGMSYLPRIQHSRIRVSCKGHLSLSDIPRELNESRPFGLVEFGADDDWLGEDESAAPEGAQSTPLIEFPIVSSETHEAPLNTTESPLPPQPKVTKVGYSGMFSR